PCGCDVLNYSKLSGPGNMAGNTYSWDPAGPDVGCHTVEVVVTDFYSAKDTCEFEIEVLNEPPVITCPEGEHHVIMGSTYTTTVTATDPDGGPLGMTFSLGAATEVTGATIGATSGEFEWTSPDDCQAVGDYEIEVIVTDGANLDDCNTENADTCYFTITVKPSFRVVIEYKTDGGLGVTQGHYYDLDVYLEPGCTVMEMGGYDFLISYEHSLGALTFISAEPGDLLVQGEWEYFTFRFGPFGNCGDACPSGLVRLTAMAETNNGAHEAIDFDNSEGDNILAVMKFYVSNDRTFECAYAPVEWFWIDCGDNTISSKEGDTLFLERWIYDFEGDLLAGPPEGYDLLPGYWGVGDDCLEEYKTFPVRAIDFKNGGFKIICGDDIDAPGDININGIANEIADAVMYTNYFIEGLSAFGAHVEASIAASDVNLDGITLSVADLVYLIRVVQGDASPYPKPAPGASDISVATQLIGGNMAISYDAVTDVGAMLMIFEVTGNLGEPTLGNGAANMDLEYRASGNELRVLIYNAADKDPASILAGRHDLLNIPVEGKLELKSVEVAVFYGFTMDASVRVLPTEFEMAQNYPNPFNPWTTIAISLPVASDYSVAIYNVAGQLIRTYSGSADAGTVEIVWDGKDAYGNQVATGVYFYKGIARDFSATKKMILMK
ncbi:MAG: T9SS type A sorting domain-containing protein, partial [Candidatus Zixiibacteriota bacterium]